MTIVRREVLPTPLDQEPTTKCNDLVRKTVKYMEQRGVI